MITAADLYMFLYCQTRGFSRLGYAVYDYGGWAFAWHDQHVAVDYAITRNETVEWIMNKARQRRGLYAIAYLKELPRFPLSTLLCRAKADKRFLIPNEEGRYDSGVSAVAYTHYGCYTIYAAQIPPAASLPHKALILRRTW